MAKPFIEVRDVTFEYALPDGKTITALNHINLRVTAGEFVAIVGPNGCGKSTLAYHFNGLCIPLHGEVWVDGLLTSDPHAVWKIRQRVGLVFQNPDNQFVASTVEEDVAFGPENLALPHEEIRARVEEALQTVGMQDYRTQPPQMLSGGQKQRVAIAGVLATRPACIILDEPTSMLDPRGRREVLRAIQRLNVEQQITILWITHSMAEAACARRIVVMHRGGIILDGPPAQVFSQRHTLEAVGLELSPAAEIAGLLRAQGIPIPVDVCTPEQLVAALC